MSIRSPRRSTSASRVSGGSGSVAISVSEAKGSTGAAMKMVDSNPGGCTSGTPAKDIDRTTLLMPTSVLVGKEVPRPWAVPDRAPEAAIVTSIVW